MTLHYHLKDTAADLDPGADNWSNYINDEPTPGVIATSIAGGATEHDYAITEPGLADFQSGIGYEVQVVIGAGDLDVELSLTLHRINNSGTIQESSAKSSPQVADVAILTYSFEGLDLGSFAYLDRVRVDFEWVNTDPVVPANINITIGSDTTRLFTPWLALVPTEVLDGDVIETTAVLDGSLAATTQTGTIPAVGAALAGSI